MVKEDIILLRFEAMVLNIGKEQVIMKIKFFLIIKKKFEYLNIIIYIFIS